MFSRSVTVCFLCFLTLVFICPTPVLAERNNNYVLLKGGTFQPDEKKLQSINNFTLGISYGHWFWDKYTHNLGFEIEGNWSQGRNTNQIGSTSVRSDWTHYAALLSLKYGKTFGNTEVFLGGGGGVYAWEARGVVGGINVHDDSIDFGLHAKAGFTYAFPSGFLLGVEGKYTWMKLNGLGSFGDGLGAFGYDVLLLLGQQW